MPTEPADLSHPDEEATPAVSPWDDLDAYVATPRLGGLALSHDGGTLVVSLSTLNADRTAYVSSLWRLDPAGERPARRLTRSVDGEAAAAFLRDGSLLFTSKRQVPSDGAESSDTTKALWCLPADGGEAYVLCRRDGGWTSVVTAPGSDLAVLGVSAHIGTADEKADAELRADRTKHKVSAILHSGVPVRYWDSDLGPEAPRLVTAQIATDGGDATVTPEAITGLTGDVGRRLGDPYSLSDDGTVLVTGWRTPRPRGVVWDTVAVWSTATKAMRVVESDDHEYDAGLVSPDGRALAAVESDPGTPDQALRQRLVLIDTDTLTPVPVAETWDRWATPAAWSPDGRTLYVTADDDGDHALFAVDIDDTDALPRRLTGPGAYTSVQVAPSGDLYAVRSSYTDPGSVWRLNPATGEAAELLAPVTYEPLPGRMERVETTAPDGSRVPAYLLLPDGASADAPAPLALWIHGGPLGSWNAWSWRWCPWLLVSHGYAVLLPDPALSTGYGWETVNRGWGRWGEPVHADLMAITDHVVARGDVDQTRTVAMGGSFGGYMANWVAGHTDRFRAIVSHASLWNLEAFGPTTDAPWYWSREMSPQMQSVASPHRYADQITTPMLVIHGDKDYRVPIGEGLALWWALVSGFDGPPEQMPHRFLYFPDENHWVLTPNHAKIWYEAVRNFLAVHVDGADEVRPALM